MSLALIEESAKEVRRLAIAGSPLAVGDFRLKKLIPPLEQAGAKVPVFAQAAKGISDLVNGKEAESAANLLNLSTLLNAILYTQGNSGAPGEAKDLETYTTANFGTQTPARVLKPLVEALTSTGGGRYETIKSAVDRGAFKDLRLIDPAIRALDDTYSEIADLVADQILPAYGPGIAPRLQRALDVKGKKADARRLQILHRLDPAGTIEACKNALENGSPEVKAAALTCLGEHEECLLLVLEYANAKNKTLRTAALTALALHDRPETVKLFTDLIKGKSLEVLSGPLGAVRNPQVFAALLEEGRRVLELVAKGEAEQLVRFSEILDCLKARNDPGTEQFLIDCLAHCKKIAKVPAGKNSVLVGQDLVLRVVEWLQEHGSPKSLAAVFAQRDLLPEEAFESVLQCALRLLPAVEFFDQYSPLLKQTKGKGKEKNYALQDAIWTAAEEASQPADPGVESGVNQAPSIALDPRWLDAALRADQPTVVCSLVTSGQMAALDYLAGKLETADVSEAENLISALARCQYPKLTDIYLGVLTKRSKKATQLDYTLRRLFNWVAYLPPAALPKLDAFAATLDPKLVDTFLESLAPLRPAVPAN